jgi:hypothetical protein
MKRLLALLCTAILLGRLPVEDLVAQGRQDQSNTPTFRATSTLVFLDVTVLDRKGRPVVTGLTKDDFTITEDKKPQRIFSFEAPETHVTGATAGDIDPDGKAPVTIFVLDLLNSSFEDFGYMRYQVRRFLMTQPPQLTSPAELMVNGNNSLDMLQGYTRSRASGRVKRDLHVNGCFCAANPAMVSYFVFAFRDPDCRGGFCAVLRSAGALAHLSHVCGVGARIFVSLRPRDVSSAGR